MVVVTILLLVALVIVSLFLISAIIHIGKIQEELEELGKEQHTQNMDIIELVKSRAQHQQMLIQHVEILQYLVDQDPKIGKKILYTGVVGQA
jgi:DNA integrity scanning protein DisA with diadenylate cyclase activity